MSQILFLYFFFTCTGVGKIFVPINPATVAFGCWVYYSNGSMRRVNNIPKVNSAGKSLMITPRLSINYVIWRYWLFNLIMPCAFLFTPQDNKICLIVYLFLI